MVTPEQEAPVTGNNLRTTGPVPADSRPERHRYVITGGPDKLGTDPTVVDGICGRRRGKREEFREQAPD